jgi:hypothetical protein
MMRRIAVMAAVVCLLFVGCTEDENAEFSFDLAGSNEVCDGDSCGGDGSGTASVDLNADREEICYEVSLEGIEGVNASHIHAGEEGESGDPVVTVTGLDDGGGTGCVDADEETIEDILADPEDFYLNVHTEELPDGAGRGQLES